MACIWLYNAGENLNRDEQLKWHHNMHVKMFLSLTTTDSMQQGFGSMSALTFCPTSFIPNCIRTHFTNFFDTPIFSSPKYIWSLTSFNFDILISSSSNPPSNFNVNLWPLFSNSQMCVFSSLKLFYWSRSLAFSPRPLFHHHSSLFHHPCSLSVFLTFNIPLSLSFSASFCPSPFYLVSFCIIDDPFSLRYAKSYIHLIFSTLLIFS